MNEKVAIIIYLIVWVTIALVFSASSVEPKIKLTIMFFYWLSLIRFLYLVLTD